MKAAGASRRVFQLLDRVSSMPTSGDKCPIRLVHASSPTNILQQGAGGKKLLFYWGLHILLKRRPIEILLINILAFGAVTLMETLNWMMYGLLTHLAQVIWYSG